MKQEDIKQCLEDFELYYSKIRGMAIATWGIDQAEEYELLSKQTFFAGFFCAKAAPEETGAQT